MNMVLRDEAAGVFRWPKGLVAQVTQDFSTLELQCHCTHPECREQIIKIDFINKLQALRDDLGAPIQINRAYSCQLHQDDLAAQGYETATHSQHVPGNAGDITSPNLAELKSLAPKYFLAIGFGARTIHVDGRTDHMHRWYYDHGM